MGACDKTLVRENFILQVPQRGSAALHSSQINYDQRVDGNALVPTTVATESKFDRLGHWMVTYQPMVQVSIKKKEKKTWWL